MYQFLSLKDHVYQFITNQIDQGIIDQDSKITEQNIADELGVSRTPVREALHQLAAVGYLEYLPRRGFKVHVLSSEELIEIYEVIGVLDAKASSLAMYELIDSDFEKMQKLIEEMDMQIEDGKYVKYNQLQRAFHDVYINKCGNKKLIAELEHLKGFLVNSHYNKDTDKIIKKVLLRTNNEHKEILKYLQKQDQGALMNYLSNVHWSSANVIFDTW